MNWPISACRRASVSLLSATLLLTAAGCEDANNLGVELPGTTAADTQYRDFPVTASTVLRDSLETQKADRFLVGRVRENVLGATAATAFLNLKVLPLVVDSLPAEVKRLETVVAPNPVLDSLVVEMPFDAVYGSAATPLRVNVFELAQPLDEQTVYNSSSSSAVGTELGRNLAARLDATRKDSAGTKPNRVQVTVPDRTVRLKLHGGGRTLALATTVFDRIKAAPATGFTQTALDAVWKGLAIQPATDFNTAVVGFLPATGARVVFYYRYTNKKNTGTLNGRYSIPFGRVGFRSLIDAPRYFTRITNELPVNSPLSRLGGPGGDTLAVAASETNGLVYMQGGNGFGVKLKIPGLDTLQRLAKPQANSQPAIAINRAELILPVKPYANLLFALPQASFLYEVNRNNQSLYRTLLNTRVERIVLRDGIPQTGQGLPSITDQSDANGNKFGYYQNAAEARLFALSDANQSFNMILTGYVQAYVYKQLGGPEPAAFILSPSLRNSFDLDLNRAVLDASNIKLRVYYSKLR